MPSDIPNQQTLFSSTMAPVVPASSLDNSSQAAVQSSVASAQEGASAAADGKQYVVLDGVR